MTQAAEYITVTEAARLLGVTRKTVYRYLEAKRLTSYERIGRVLLNREEVLAFGRVRPVEASLPPDAAGDGV